MKIIRKYWRIWIRTATMAMLAQLSYRLGSAGFFLGKMIRLFFFFAFMAAVFTHVESIAGYSITETALFFMTYNLVDMTAQILFRGVYNARRTVTDGDFDFYLIQPCSPLFRMTCSTVDFLDLLAIIPVVIMTGIVFSRLPPAPLSAYAAYSFLLLNAVVLIFAIHVLVAAIAVRTQELESLIWIYRDVMFMGKFPVDVFTPSVRWALTLIIPIAVMTTFPAKALLGRLSGAWMAYAAALSTLVLPLSVRFWHASVARYTSSSS